jgi:hypothetical protein
VFAFVKRLVPAQIKQTIRDHQRRRRFLMALSVYSAVEPSCDPPGSVLTELVAAWNNEGYSAHNEYLIELIHRARQSTGPILECGSGLSTVVVGLELQRRGQKLYVLEHHSQWSARVRSDLQSATIASVTVLDAPLKDYGTYCWYDVTGAMLPSQFHLVICDGPPGDTPGGRYGLVPVMRDHLAPGCATLLDDYEREDEQAIARRWREETGAEVKVYGSQKPYAVVQLP